MVIRVVPSILDDIWSDGECGGYEPNAVFFFLTKYFIDSFNFYYLSLIWALNINFSPIYFIHKMLNWVFLTLFFV